MEQQNNQIKSKMTYGVTWKFSEKILIQIVQFVLQIILARILNPEDFGLIAILTVFITLSDIVILYGVTTALVQKKDINQIEMSSVFFINIGLSLVIYAILFFCSPLISKFYEEEQLTNLLRILSLNIIFGALCAVHNVIITRALDFKKSFIRNAFNVAVQAFVGIFCACNGFGVWSLVLSKISGCVVGSLTLLILVKWHPSCQFSWKRVRPLFRFSSKMLANNFLGSILQNISSLVIGKYYSSAELGYYQKGQQFPQTAMAAVDGSMSEVLYPSFSSMQSDLNLVKRALSRSMKLSMYLVMPILVGGIVVARPLVLLLLGTKWEPCIPFFQLQCIVCMFWPLAARNQALNAIGKSTITLITSLIANTIVLIFIFIGIRYSIFIAMIGTIVSNLLTLFISSYFTKKYIGYSITDLLKDIAPTTLLAIFMGGCVYLISFFGFSNLITLLFQVILGIIIYIGISLLLKIETFKYLIGFLKGLRKNAKE